MKYIVIIITLLFIISTLIVWFTMNSDGGSRDRENDLLSKNAPSEVVDAFYELWLDTDDSLSSMAYDDSRFVTRAFVLLNDELLEATDRGTYDPIVCSFDTPESYEVSTLRETPDAAEIAVRMRYKEEEREVRVHVNKDLGEWKIDRIVCPH
jgi:hypothetical protein